MFFSLQHQLLHQTKTSTSFEIWCSLTWPKPCQACKMGLAGCTWSSAQESGPTSMSARKLISLSVPVLTQPRLGLENYQPHHPEGVPGAGPCRDNPALCQQAMPPDTTTHPTSCGELSRETQHQGDGKEDDTAVGLAKPRCELLQ